MVVGEAGSGVGSGEVRLLIDLLSCPAPLRACLLWAMTPDLPRLPRCQFPTARRGWG